ncbi:hypothetical protein KCP70_06060 [Salmonella enterica subsp. enterica]|nr:hypothetical protein KCP70_06060 [Salmonella enterica subsp. enterica]
MGNGDVGAAVVHLCLRLPVLPTSRAVKFGLCFSSRMVSPSVLCTVYGCRPVDIVSSIMIGTSLPNGSAVGLHQRGYPWPGAVVPLPCGGIPHSYFLGGRFFLRSM